MRARPAFSALALWLVPSLALAHPGAGASDAFGAGFSHPWLGWDHLLTMLAVGIWTAQQRGLRALAIPGSFLALMSLGGVVGMGRVSPPVVEPALAVSVLLFGVLVGLRARPPVGWAMALSGFFAFFHGVAHGSEAPSAASLLSFGLGFLAATAALQGIGWMLARVLGALAASAVAPAALAQDVQPKPQSATIEEIVVKGRADSLIGVADSASQGTVGAEQLALRPLLRVGEVLETVPGVIVTQHAGGGKANQYFARGFNLDHGTDFATSLDGVPMNLPSHGHGQGYTDLNGLIPELIERVDYRKGLYYADVGDFGSVGAVDVALADSLEDSVASFEAGSFDTYRGVLASSRSLGPGELLYGFETGYSNGPWKRGDDFLKLAGVVRYGWGDPSSRFRVTALGYHGEWDSSDQIAQSAVASVGRFGSLDRTTGGDSQRYTLAADWRRTDERSETRALGYLFYYDLDLFSNFTYFLTDPIRGDQFEQMDRRWTGGVSASHTWLGSLAGRTAKTRIGFEARHDGIENGLFNTEARRRIAKVDRDGAAIPATTRRDEIQETSLAPYLESEIRWGEKLRSIAGVRLDTYRFHDDDRVGPNSGKRGDVIASPKLTLVLGPWADTEIYLQGGLGFHSNDARGVTTRIDPASRQPVDRADPLVQTGGAELGLRTTRLPGLQTTLSAWWLDMDSELLFVGDAGTTEPSRPSRRYGVELANYYTPLEHLTFDLDVSLSHARFRDSAPEGDHIPGSIESVVAGGATLHGWRGLSFGLRLRYFGRRPLIEDDSVRSDGTILLGAQLRYELNDRFAVTAEGFNLLDRKDSDIDYFYESAISASAPVHEQIHFHPVEPIAGRIALEARF
jgi:hydrogenase/urease accessory protein HupE